MQQMEDELSQVEHGTKYIHLKIKHEELEVPKEIEKDAGEEINLSKDESKEIIQPYMSEEIHSVLKEMGAYLLEEELDEIAATLEELDEVEEVIKKKSEVTLEDFRRRLIKNLQGRKLTTHITCQSGEYIGRQGDEVTLQMLQIARENGCMIKIMRHSQ